MGWIVVAFAIGLCMLVAVHRSRHATGRVHKMGPITVRVNPARRGMFRRMRNQTD